MLLERTTTSLLNGAMRNSTRQLQVDLQNAQTETSTGRYADAGLILGANVGRNLDWRSEIERLTTTLKRNDMSAERAKVTQAGVEAVKDQASYLMNTIVGARSAANGGALARTAGENAINGMMQILSTTYSGQYVFSGNTPDSAPLADYVGGPAQGAFDAAFQAEFGFAKTDPQASTITPSQMQTFLQGRYDDLFKDPQWTSDWSTSSAENQKARIDGTTTVNADANANEDAFRLAMKAAVAAYELGGTNIGQGTFQVVADTAAKTLSQSVQALGDVQARVGFAEQAIEQANTRMTSKKTLLETSVTKTEGVSAYDAATRLNALTTQLEASYSVTARISKLSLLNYL